MGIQNWSDNVILVNLAQEPQLGEELQTVTSIVTGKKGYSVVVDFADVAIITSSSLAKLLKLRKVLYENDGRLVLSTVRPQTRNVFAVAGLEQVFEFVDDQFVALAGLQMVQ